MEKSVDLWDGPVLASSPPKIQPMIRSVILRIDGKDVRVGFKDAVRFMKQMQQLVGEEKPKPTAPWGEEDVEKLAALWEVATTNAKTRSSKQNVKKVWMEIPKKDRPTKEVLCSAYQQWLECDQWSREDGAYIPGLHRWVKDRQWENIPKPSRPASGLGPLG